MGGVVHEEEVDHVAVDTDKTLGGIGDDRREADDEGYKGHGTQARAHPNEDHGGDGNDRDGLQEDGVGVEHAAYPRGLSEDERDHEADNECSEEASGCG